MLMRLFISVVLFVFTCACGVKGRPLPPDSDPHIGRGSPLPFTKDLSNGSDDEEKP